MVKASKDDEPASGRLRVAIGSDHRGYRLKERLVMSLREDRRSVKDHGVHNDDPCDYPEITEMVSRAVLAGEADLGIVVASSGAGAAMAANKLPGIRALHCQDTFSARQGRRTLAANVLTVGARVMGDDLALEVARAWLAAEVSDDERAQRLIQRIELLEEQFDSERMTLRTRLDSANS